MKPLDAELTPALPLLVMAFSVGKASAVKLCLRYWRAVKEEDVVNLPKDPDSGAYGRLFCRRCNLHLRMGAAEFDGAGKGRRIAS